MQDTFDNWFLIAILVATWILGAVMAIIFMCQKEEKP